MRLSPGCRLALFGNVIFRALCPDLKIDNPFKFKPIWMSSRFEPSSIKNKVKREEVSRKTKKSKSHAKLQRRLAQAKLEASDPIAKKVRSLLWSALLILSEHLQKRLAENVPRTLDNTREYDPSILTADPTQSGPSALDDQPDESAADIAADPFASYFSSTEDPTTPPKILITTSPKASKSTYDFCDELVGVFPGAEFIRRKKGKGFEMGRIAGWAAGRGYKHLCVINEDMKKPSTSSSQAFYSGLVITQRADAIILVHLPNGPSAYFKLTSIELTKQIFVNANEHHIFSCSNRYFRVMLVPPRTIQNLFWMVL